MTVLEQQQRRIARSPAMALDYEQDVLSRIAEPRVALAVWRRELVQALHGELAMLRLDHIDDLLLTSSLDDLPETLRQAMDEAGYPPAPALHADVLMLARRQGEISGTREVKVRLEVIDSDACRKFHADWVTVRTITTYVGLGTQWIDLRGAERAVRPEGAAIERIGAGAVALFKGRVWQEEPTILHRSPPLGASGQRRLVLVIDAAPSQEGLSMHPGEPCQ